MPSQISAWATPAGTSWITASQVTVPKVNREASHPIHGGNQQGYRNGVEPRLNCAVCLVEGHGGGWTVVVGSLGNGSWSVWQWSARWPRQAGRESLEAETSAVSCWFILAGGDEAYKRRKGEGGVDLTGDLPGHIKDMKKADRDGAAGSLTQAKSH